MFNHPVQGVNNEYNICINYGIMVDDDGVDKVESKEPEEKPEIEQANWGWSWRLERISTWWSNSPASSQGR